MLPPYALPVLQSLLCCQTSLLECGYSLVEFAVRMYTTWLHIVHQVAGKADLEVGHIQVIQIHTQTIF